MGWSAGGTTALIIAANYEQNVNKLVIWSANSYLSSHEKQISQLGRDPETIADKMKELHINVYRKETFNKLWTELCDAYGRYDDICKSDLPNIKCPTFILHSKQDPIVSARHALYLNQNIKNCRIHWFSGPYHNIHYKFAKDFNKLVQDFLLEDQENTKL
jgi:valacyclovir hydrolase